MPYRMRVLLIIILLVTFSVFVLSKQTIFHSANIQSVKAQTSTLDWPQYQHDENRTGYNPVTTASYNYTELWKHTFINDAISSTNQAIVIGNSVLIGTEKGIVYAYDVTNSNELWHTPLDGAITHAIAGTDAYIFAATLAGNVYALDIDSGVIKGTLSLPAIFSSAVLLVPSEQKIYLADEYGSLYAIAYDANGNLNQTWKKDIGFRLLQSPVYGNNAIYVGAEDMKMHAFNASNGTKLWDSPQMNGQSFHNYTPVFTQGKIAVYTALAPYQNMLPVKGTADDVLLQQTCMDIVDANNSKILDPNYYQNQGWFSATELATAQDKTIQWREADTTRGNFYVVDASSGTLPYTPGILDVVVNSGAHAPMVFAQGYGYTNFHVLGGRQHRQKWATEMGSLWIDYGAFGKLDMSTGRIVQRITAPRGSFPWGTMNPADSPGEITIDETNTITGAGDILIGARCGNKPACSDFRNTANRCTITGTSSLSLTADLCRPGSAPFYANGYMIHQIWNTLYVYKGQ